jgi:hypothetical protein
MRLRGPGALPPGPCRIQTHRALASARSPDWIAVKPTGGILLLLLALFMLLGFVRSDADASAPTTMLALLLAIALPAAAGVALLRSHFAGPARSAARRDELRQHTLDAEILRLAAHHGGRLTLVEVMTALAISGEAAQQSLNRLAARDIAEIRITDSGVLVYAFHDIQRLDEKTESRGLLE